MFNIQKAQYIFLLFTEVGSLLGEEISVLM